MSNKNLFLKKEADKYFYRNKSNTTKENSKDKLLSVILKLIEKSKKKNLNILEVGCGEGRMLNYLNQKFPNLHLYGIDPSSKAVSLLKKKNIKATKGTADKLPYKKNYFDIVIMGFCLYLVDNKDLFTVASETYRVMDDKSFLVIKDFDTKNIKFKKYKHNDKIKIRKMNNQNIFLWHPSMNLIFKESFDHNKDFWSDNEDQTVSISCIRKSEIV